MTLVIVFTWILPLSLYAQGDAIDMTSTPKHGCQEVDVHCKCTNPEKDFVVKGQKLGRTNPGEPGECKTKKEIDASASQMPIAYCLPTGAQKDSRKGMSRCTATWKCVKACTIKPGYK